MIKVNPENYVAVQGWMRTELDLKGNDLLVYAIIYGYSQDGESEFTGSLQYLADWCGATKSGIQKNLKNLLDKDLIKKREIEKNGVKFCAYSCILCNSVVRGIQHSCTNNIDNTQEDIISINTNNIVVNTNSQNFTFGTKQTKPKKQNLYSRCVALINNKTDDKELQKLLVDWLNMLLEKYRDRKKVLYENVFKGKLNTLDEYDKKDWKDVIQYNLQRGYEAFYPIKEYKHNDMEVISSEYGIVNSYKYTDEERKRQEEWRAEMKRNGKRIEF